MPRKKIARKAQSTVADDVLIHLCDNVWFQVRERVGFKVMIHILEEVREPVEVRVTNAPVHVPERHIPFEILP
jgi:hypothetical protein